MKNILMIGRGKTGVSIQQWGLKKNVSVTFFEDHKDDYTNFILTLKQYDALIVSPSTKSDHPLILAAKEINIDVLTDIDIFLSSLKNTLCIAITGTNGKSTTTALVGHVLQNIYKKVYIGGNIGIPVLDFVDEEADAFVLELSSYQLEHSQPFAFEAAALLNITPDHLDHHKTMAAYIAAKEKIFEKSKNGIICIDDAFTKNIYNTKKNKSSFYTVSTKEKADFWIKDNLYCMYQEQILLKTEGLFLKGEHNLQNILATFAMCHCLKIPLLDVAPHIKTFKGLYHRQEHVCVKDNILFINDSKATNADATEKALLAFKDFDIYWILGGRSKSDGIDPLEPYFNTIKKAYLIGEAANQFHNILAPKVPTEILKTLDHAVLSAFEDAKKESSDNEKVILFSPACASFDQFKNFEERGDFFKSACKNVIQKIPSKHEGYCK
ncbi:MAG: UDP-N-acetylmuramoylalanine--D-glutamate ligase [Holosporales bacterium]